jgi:hypothetical protein
MNVHPYSKHVLPILLAVGLSSSFAQAPAADPGLDARVRSALLRSAPALSPEGPELTGSEDLLLLEKRDFFTASASLTPQFTNNAALSNDDPTSDFAGIGDLGLEWRTVYNNRYDLRARLGVTTARYDELDNLDYSAATVNLGAARGFSAGALPVTVGVQLQPTVIFDRGFSDRQLTQYRVGVTTETLISLAGRGGLGATGWRRLSIVPSLTLERVFANPSPYENSAISLDFAVIYPLRSNLRIAGNVGGFYRDYDDYFEGFVGSARRDHGARAGIELLYAPRAGIQVAFTTGFVRNQSTSDVNRYDSLSASPTLAFRMTF